MSKAIQFKMPAPQANSADGWVQDGVEPHLKPAKTESRATPTKRFTLDVPAELHARVKVGCARRGKTMLDVICEWLEAEFPPEPENRKIV